MSQSSKKSNFNILIATLAGLLIAKVAWVGLEITKLPKSGVDLEKTNSLKALFYHYNLASKKELPKVIVNKNKPKVKIIKQKPKLQKITKMILKGLYNSKERKVIVVEYLGKSYALALGEEIEGYKFIKLYPTYAILKKDGKEFQLDLYKKDAKKEKQKSSNVTITPSAIKVKKETKIEHAGDTTYIPKNLFNKYRSNNVRKGSDFDKLGVKRGDIITAINGEALNNFKVPLEFFNNLDTISAAELTIKRGNEIKELEYEVR